MTTKATKHHTSRKTHPETGEELPITESEPQAEQAQPADDPKAEREPDWSATGCLSVEETEARIRFNERAQQKANENAG